MDDMHTKSIQCTGAINHKFRLWALDMEGRKGDERKKY